MHGCDATIASLQLNIKSAQIILRPAFANIDDSPAAGSKYDKWELTAQRVSGPHLGWFDGNPNAVVEIWLLVLTAPCTENTSVHGSIQNQVETLHLFLLDDVLNLLGHPSHRQPLATHTNKVRTQFG